MTGLKRGHDDYQLGGGAKLLRAAAPGRSGNAAFYPALEWRRVSKAFPTTPIPANIASNSIKSDVNDSYEGSGADSAKLIITLPRGISIRDKTLLLHLPIMTLSTNMLAGQANYSISTTALILAYLRVRGIVSEYDPALSTWNNKVVTPDVTYGTTVYEMFISAQYSSTTVAVSKRANTQNFQFETGSNLDTLYGVIIDVKPFATSTNLLSTNAEAILNQMTGEVSDTTRYPGVLTFEKKIYSELGF